MKKALGWAYYVGYEIAQLILKVVGLLALLPLCLLGLWTTRPSHAAMFKDRTVTVFDNLQAAFSAATAGVFIGLLIGPKTTAILAIAAGFLALSGVYNNEEDGNVPPALVNGQPYWPGKPAWFRAYMWSAWRNAVDGMRWWPLASLLLPTKPTFQATKNGYVMTCGWRQCVVWKAVRFGWLINKEADVGYRAWPTLEKFP